MEIIDPRGLVAAHTRPGLAPRRARAREGLRIGFLVNEQTRSQGPDFYGYTLALEEELRSRGALLDVVRVGKPLLSRPAEPALLDELRFVQGVINGLAK
ncbi:MAG: hypothetical protein E4H11_02370 [Myxococcales bacterium]|jgi:hypothetical protein|nr:MAG: hypothetical protein E4H11_02370 [Myxococcales bacterium]